MSASVFFFSTLDHKSVLITKWKSCVFWIYKNLLRTIDKCELGTFPEVYKEFNQRFFELVNMQRLQPVTALLLFWTSYLISNMPVMVSLVNLRIFNRWVVLSNMRWISVPLCLRTCCKINFAEGSNVSGKSTKRCRKNMPSTILTSMVPVLEEVMQFSSLTGSLDIGVFCLVPSGWHNYKGSGVSGYHNTSSISTLAYKAWNKMLTKRSLVIVTVTSFLFYALVTLNLPVWGQNS